ncbi:MAG: hypothetical protein L6W00_06560 [Lentisphaeria bacterium]|nr:MAG: hypothetical protein L6W00_06560 [Lentisphaeria bacterium]
MNAFRADKFNHLHMSAIVQLHKETGEQGIVVLRDSFFLGVVLFHPFHEPFFVKLADCIADRPAPDIARISFVHEAEADIHRVIFQRHPCIRIDMVNPCMTKCLPIFKNRI